MVRNNKINTIVYLVTYLNCKQSEKNNEYKKNTNIDQNITHTWYELKINYGIQMKKIKILNARDRLTLYRAVHTRCLSTTICSERREIYHVKQDT